MGYVCPITNEMYEFIGTNKVVRKKGLKHTLYVYYIRALVFGTLHPECDYLTRNYRDIRSKWNHHISMFPEKQYTLWSHRRPFSYIFFVRFGGRRNLTNMSGCSNFKNQDFLQLIEGTTFSTFRG